MFTNESTPASDPTNVIIARKHLFSVKILRNTYCHTYDRHLVIMVNSILQAITDLIG